MSSSKSRLACGFSASRARSWKNFSPPLGLAVEQRQQALLGPGARGAPRRARRRLVDQRAERVARGHDLLGRRRRPLAPAPRTAGRPGRGCRAAPAGFGCSTDERSCGIVSRSRLAAATRGLRPLATVACPRLLRRLRRLGAGRPGAARPPGIGMMTVRSPVRSANGSSGSSRAPPRTRARARGTRPRCASRARRTARSLFQRSPLASSSK